VPLTVFGKTRVRTGAGRSPHLLAGLGGLIIGLAGLCRLVRQIVKRLAHALGEHLDVRAVVPVSDRGEVD